MDHMCVLQNRSESDPRSYEATKAVAKKAHAGTFLRVKYNTLYTSQRYNRIHATQIISLDKKHKQRKL